MYPDCEEPATTANFIAETSQVVAGSMHTGKLNGIVPLSSVQFSAVHWALKTLLGEEWRVLVTVGPVIRTAGIQQSVKAAGC